jgi:uncharacterized protein YbgA (DUF1722 family)/uncharacterized protein YbbK (DUF523 family)
VELAKVRIGISACLLGEDVRFDGGHKRDSFLTEVLGPHVEWVPVCPEVEVGMGTPREALRLVRHQGSVRMITIRTGVDHTDAMNGWARQRVEQLARDHLSGYVLKSKSPSCGMEGVTVYTVKGVASPAGRGLFAEVLLKRLPFLPVEEEGRLSDSVLRENFIERVFAYRRLEDLFTGRWTAGSLVAFHTRHKMALLAHSPTGYRRLGNLVASAAAVPRKELAAQYRRQFMSVMSIVATRGRHANVLTHMAGHLERLLDDGSKRELVDYIDEYRRGLLPLTVPITLLRHHVRQHGVGCLAEQSYLDPHPRELMLRNHV